MISMTRVFLSDERCCEYPIGTVSHLLPPATSLRQGNVYTPVCDSVHRRISVWGSLFERGLCLREVSVWGVSVQGGLSKSGLCQGDRCLGSLFLGRSVKEVSVWRSLFGAVSVQGGSVIGPPPTIQ